MSLSDDVLLKSLRLFNLNDFVNNEQKEAVKGILTRKSTIMILRLCVTHYGVNDSQIVLNFKCCQFN